MLDHSYLQCSALDLSVLLYRPVPTSHFGDFKTNGKFRYTIQATHLNRDPSFKRYHRLKSYSVTQLAKCRMHSHIRPIKAGRAVSQAARFERTPERCVALHSADPGQWTAPSRAVTESLAPSIVKCYKPMSSFGASLLAHCFVGSHRLADHL